MKIWKFYYIGDLKDIFHSYEVDSAGRIKWKKKREELLENQYPLYAYTSEKELAQLFQIERNMNHFVLKKEHMDKDEYKHEFIKNNPNGYLQMYTLTTRSKKEREDGKMMESVVMPITQFERMEITDFDISFYLGDDFNIPKPKKYLKIFKQEMFQALRTLGYEFILYLGSTSDNSFEPDENVIEVFEGYDELTLLCKNFRGTFL